MNDTTFSGNGKVSFIPVITNADPKPMSNGDKIRAKSDYDLADWIAQVLMYHGSFSSRPLTIDDNECPHECPLYKCCNDQPSDNIEDWLKAPVEDREVDK